MLHSLQDGYVYVAMQGITSLVCFALLLFMVHFLSHLTLIQPRRHGNVFKVQIYIVAICQLP